MDGSEMDRAKYDKYVAMLESTRAYNPDKPHYTVVEETIPQVCMIMDDE
jgi:hypothetical protein